MPVRKTCAVCGAGYRCKPYEVDRSRYCSPPCRAIGAGRTRTKPIEDRYWPKVDRRGPDECWPWKGATTHGGYGVLGVGGRRGPIVRAHRLALILIGQIVPDGLEVLHSCDNPPCCNPAHLSIGTHKDNFSDAVQKGRVPHGEQHHAAKLTDTQVAEIRKRVASGEKKIRLAEEFCISRGYVTILMQGHRR